METLPLTPVGNAGGEQRPARVSSSETDLQFIGGMAGAFVPFVVFVVGVLSLTLSGIGNERAFWPVLVLALCVGLALARDRTRYSEIVIEGMSHPIVMIMIMAWWLSSILGMMLNATDFIKALTWLAGSLHVGSTSFVVVTFLICCLVSTSTGTSFGTILICGPILYPAGGLLGAHLPTLAGAIIGGATFGDSISPLSDTSIASAYSQNADIGGTVRSRIKYVVIAAAVAIILYVISAITAGTSPPRGAAVVTGGPRALWMLLVPAVVIFLLLRNHHLLVGLLTGIVMAVAVGLGFGLLAPAKLMSIGPDHAVHSLIIDGIDRALGVTVFTVFLVGIVATLKASGLMRKVVDFSEHRIHSARSAEVWIVCTVMAMVLIIQQVIVAMLTVAEFTRQTGERFGIHAYRRANLLDLTVSTFPFILPYFLPVLLMTGATRSGSPYGIPPVSPAMVGLYNFHSWAVLAVVILAVSTGFGRRFVSDQDAAVDAASSIARGASSAKAGVEMP